jgi:hypothetical protein
VQMVKILRKAVDVKHLRQIESENARLKKLL